MSMQNERKCKKRNEQNKQLTNHKQDINIKGMYGVICLHIEHLPFFCFRFSHVANNHSTRFANFVVATIGRMDK